MITSSKVIRTKREELMAFIQLEDLHGGVEVIVFPSVYASCQDLLSDDHPVMVQGKVQLDEKGAKILADTVIPMEKAEAMWTAKVQFNIDAQRSDKAVLADLRDLLRRHPGDCQGMICIKMANDVETVLAMAESWRFRPGDALTREVNGLLGYPAVETLCGEIHTPANGNGKKRWKR
jgi:DNA polymerase-3 subunit alpha